MSVNKYNKLEPIQLITFNDITDYYDIDRLLNHVTTTLQQRSLQQSNDLINADPKIEQNREMIEYGLKDNTK